MLKNPWTWVLLVAAAVVAWVLFRKAPAPRRVVTSEGGIPTNYLPTANDTVGAAALRDRVTRLGAALL